MDLDGHPRVLNGFGTWTREGLKPVSSPSELPKPSYTLIYSEDSAQQLRSSP